MKLLKHFTIYLLYIFAFGAFYYIYFKIYPDSFYATAEFNLHPFSSSVIMGNTGYDLKVYQQLADSLRIANDSSNLKIKKMLWETDSIKPVLSAISKQFEDIQWKNVEIWRERQVQTQCVNA